LFHTATWKEIKAGLVTDVYFERTKKILQAKGLDVSVRAEFMVKALPANWPWAVLAGVEECAEVLRGLPVEVRTMKEGTIFGTLQPVMEISGKYLDFGQHETTLLGFLCQASGVATMAARCKKAAGMKEVISFGARRMHPAVAPLIERNAYIGGCDGVSVGLGAKLIGKDPAGTMPHALILIMGDTVTATKAFDEVIEPKVKRISLIDTFNDEKIEALNVARELGDKLYAVRLDTPGSRRGDFLEIMREVRWELDLRGFTGIKLFLSGGLNEGDIERYNVFADGYGVGTAISNAPVVDFSMDIIEVDGQSVAKRGKMSGRKRVFRCSDCFAARVCPMKERPARCSCGGREEELLAPFLSGGQMEFPVPTPAQIREFVLRQLGKVTLDR
jgi:nicotinate phosphoribosyltransferase